MKYSILFMIIAALFSVLPCASTSAAAPRLVLFLTVDQLRGDMPMRFQERFGDGGFRYLMERGVHFRNAHYLHANTFTAVGHATLATGGNTPQHGIAGNEWIDRSSGAEVYCVEDSGCVVLGATGESAAGRSPNNLTASTFGDELVQATGGAARVFSVSMKDRGAILMGGHLGKAFWYEPDTGRFVTSSYYYESYPDWVTRWNDAKHADAWLGVPWGLLHPVDTYVFSAQDGRPGERPYKAQGREFPHPMPATTAPDYYGTLRFTPMGDLLTLQFATELMRAEALGGRGQTDVLAVSLSATDYIGHAFGPGSLEAEDNLIRLDRSLAAFFSAVDGQVGLDNTLIVLSSDHGVDEIPEYTQHLGCDAGRHDPEEFLAAANVALRSRFDVEADLVTAFRNPSLYLDETAVERLGLDISDVEEALSEVITAMPGFDGAVTRSRLMQGRLPDTKLMDRVLRAFHPTRSGNVIVIQSKSWYLYPEAQKFAAMHGSPHSYDTYVPIFFAGPGIKPHISHRPVAPEDIASTITGYLGLKPPTGNTGTPLLEVLE